MPTNTTQVSGSLIDEEARRRFEAAWRAGKPQPVEVFLPAEDSPLYQATLEELAQIDMELRWKARRGSDAPTAVPGSLPPAPRAEDYLARFPCLHQPERIRRLLRQEFLCRQRCGDRPDVADYRRRFPDLSLADEELEPTCPGPTNSTEELPQVPGYEIRGVLGRGGMGKVYQAVQLSLGRVVALKQVLGGAGATAEDLARFRKEAEAVARLQHPNIVQIYEVGQAAGRPYIALEYVAGGNLARRLAGTPQPARLAAGFVQTLSRAVHYAHERGIVHRDLKPANILVQESEAGSRQAEGAQPAAEFCLLSADSVPKVTDFGLAKELAGEEGKSLTETGAILGTPSYMAPEQAAGKKGVGPAADVYALGAILYEMLSGRPPFKGETPLDTVAQVLHDDPVTPRRLQPRLARDLETICLKCLEKEPKKRYASAASLADDLGRFLDGVPIHARPIGRAGRLWRWCRRKPALAGLSATLVLVLVGAVAGLFFWQEAEHKRRRQALEFEYRQQEEALRRLGRLRQAAETNQQLALGELHADNLPAAQKFLRRVLEAVRNEPSLTGVKEDLERTDDQVSRLMDFYQLADRAERLAFFESDEAALRTCEAGLKRLGVFDEPKRWWERLRADDLEPGQAEKLKRDVNHQLTILAALWVKEGMLNPASEASTRAYRTALEVASMVQDFHQAQGLPPSMSARVVETYCHFRLWQFTRIKSFRGLEPVTATDSYLIGIATFWMAAEPNDPISVALTWTFKTLGIDLGRLDLNAQLLLRRAAAEEPRRYWTHLWLGWMLLRADDPRGAELAFTTCVTLRPDYALAYAERARALAIQSQKTDDAFARKDLRRRCLADLQRAVALDPNDWTVQLLRLDAHAWLRQKEEAVQAAARVLELTPAPGAVVRRTQDQQVEALKLIERYLTGLGPAESADAEVQAVLALACVMLNKDGEALQAATRALEVSPTHPRARAVRDLALVVRGTVALRRKEVDKALQDFERVLAESPRHYLALSGKGSAHELANQPDQALASFDALLQVAVTDWQRLEAHLGRARALARSGRADEARAALAQARAIDPRIADVQAAEIFPAPGPQK